MAHGNKGYRGNKLFPYFPYSPIPININPLIKPVLSQISILYIFLMYYKKAPPV